MLLDAQGQAEVVCALSEGLQQEAEGKYAGGAESGDEEERADEPGQMEAPVKEPREECGGEDEGQQPAEAAEADNEVQPPAQSRQASLQQGRGRGRCGGHGAGAGQGRGAGGGGGD